MKQDDEKRQPFLVFPNICNTNSEDDDPNLFLPTSLRYYKGQYYPTILQISNLQHLIVIEFHHLMEKEFSRDFKKLSSLQTIDISCTISTVDIETLLHNLHDTMTSIKLPLYSAESVLREVRFSKFKQITTLQFNITPYQAYIRNHLPLPTTIDFPLSLTELAMTTDYLSMAQELPPKLRSLYTISI
jgi:hypothetical protein